ncbi:unnamed protein product [Lymnaea stagnalis]|uniref:Uncharacterized protein n=1 Tax=Lymnaea stagnalis TaxID=6523 RepID=A0AAV2HKY7_LYMST
MAGKADDSAMSEEDEENIQLPDTWPTEDALKSDSVTFVDVQDEKCLRLFKRTMSENSVVYPMKNLISGNVLVINNETFIKLEQRKGTVHDCNKIRAVFSQLGFNVIIYNNLTKCQMEETLLRESKNDYSNHDCFILFILSHGDRGVVLGTDANTQNRDNNLSIVYIRRLFSENKSLLGKPKLFFIQACQGGQLDTGHTIDDEPSRVSHLNIESSPIKSEQNDSPYSEAANSSYVEDEETTDGTKIPSEADIFLSTATVEGCVSWRNVTYGSWYIQAICYVFRKYAYKNNLNDLMTLVNNLVSKSETKKGHKQVATKYDTLRKKLFFFPCLHEPYVEIIHKYRQGKSEKQKLEKKLEHVCLKLEKKNKLHEVEIEKLKTLERELNNRNEMIATLTKQEEQEKVLKLSLEDEIATLKLDYHNEKKQKQELESDLKIRDETIALLNQQCDSETEKRQVAEDDLKKRMDVLCNQCSNPSNSKRLYNRSQISQGLQSTADLDLLIIGGTGSGKSAVGNSILKRNAFISKFSTSSVTTDVVCEIGEHNGRKIKVIDGPGFGDNFMSTESDINLLKKAISANPSGYHAVLLVFRYGVRFTVQDEDTIRNLKNILGENFIKSFCILVMTCGDLFDIDDLGLTSEQLCSKANRNFQTILRECCDRIIWFDNKTKDEDKRNKQTSELIKMVDQLNPSGHRYTMGNFKR